MIDTLRSVSHLQKELGDDLFNALVSSDNTSAVREFAQKLLDGSVPTTMTIAGRTYDLLGFLKGTETQIKGKVMVTRAKEMSAHLGEDDGKYILEHQDEIPVALRGKVAFVFTDWRSPGDSENVACLYWDDDRWVQFWDWLDSGSWGGGGRVLRRK